jgi:hypothetical protein
MRPCRVIDTGVTFLVAGFAVSLLLSSPGVANGRNSAATQFTIVGDRIVGGVRMGATLADATTVLGMPDVQRRLSRYECRAGWRAIRLTFVFLDLSNGDPCGRGGLVRATAGSATWQTGRGLHVGDSVRRLRSLYRTATYHRVGEQGWWLITRRTCPTTGSQRYPGLLARMFQRHVGALVVGIAACE